MAKTPIAKQAPGTLGSPAATSPFIELGTSGLKRFSGYVVEEFLRVLQGRRAAEIFREMRENDAIVNAMLFAIEYLARQVTWHVTPASQAPEDQQLAEFVESCTSDLSTTWADTVAEILSMLPYGFAYHEIIYKRRGGQSEDSTQRSRFEDGRIGWRKIALRSQDSLLHWEFDEEGGVQAMVQLAPPKYQVVTIPIIKSLLFRPTTWKANPEGRSMIRGAYKSWYYLKRLQEYEAIGIERDLAGYPVATPKTDPQGNIMGPDLWNPNDPAAAAQLQTVQNFIRSVRRDEQEGAVIPGWLDFKLLSTGSRRQYDTDAIITRYEQRIAMTVLADFILLGQEAVGSFALSANKTKLFGLALGSFLDAIAEVFNRHAIPRLLALNGWAGRPLPRLTHGQIDTPDLGALGTFVSQIAGTGIDFTDPALTAALLSAAKLPTTDPTEIAKGRLTVRKDGAGWRLDPERRLFVSTVRELRDQVAKLGAGNGHAAPAAPPPSSEGAMTP